MDFIFYSHHLVPSNYSIDFLLKNIYYTDQYRSKQLNIAGI